MAVSRRVLMVGWTRFGLEQAGHGAGWFFMKNAQRAYNIGQSHESIPETPQHNIPSFIVTSHKRHAKH